MTLFLHWLIGLLLISFFSFPQIFLIGLLRTSTMRFEMSLPTTVRIFYNGFQGLIAWYATAVLWSWIFDFGLPLIFVVVCFIYSLISNFFFGQWNKLVGLSQVNEISLLIGAVFYVLFALISGEYLLLP